MCEEFPKNELKEIYAMEPSIKRAKRVGMLVGWCLWNPHKKMDEDLARCFKEHLWYDWTVVQALSTGHPDVLEIMRQNKRHIPKDLLYKLSLSIYGKDSSRLVENISILLSLGITESFSRFKKLAGNKKLAWYCNQPRGFEIFEITREDALQNCLLIPELAAMLSDQDLEQARYNRMNLLHKLVVDVSRNMRTTSDTNLILRMLWETHYNCFFRVPGLNKFITMLSKEGPASFIRKELARDVYTVLMLGSRDGDNVLSLLDPFILNFIVRLLINSRT